MLSFQPGFRPRARTTERVPPLAFVTDQPSLHRPRSLFSRNTRPLCDEQVGGGGVEGSAKISHNSNLETARESVHVNARESSRRPFSEVR